MLHTVNFFCKFNEHYLTIVVSLNGKYYLSWTVEWDNIKSSGCGLNWVSGMKTKIVNVAIYESFYNGFGLCIFELIFPVAITMIYWLYGIILFVLRLIFAHLVAYDLLKYLYENQRSDFLFFHWIYKNRVEIKKENWNLSIKWTLDLYRLHTYTWRILNLWVYNDKPWEISSLTLSQTLENYLIHSVRIICTFAIRFCFSGSKNFESLWMPTLSTTSLCIHCGKVSAAMEWMVNSFLSF